MLQISRKVEYALRAAVYLAGRDPEQMVSFREIGEAQEVPQEFLAKILRSLVTTGLIESRRGAAGGYRLARPAHTITFLEVVEAVDGPIALNECCDAGIGCAHAGACSMESVWQRAEMAMKEVFREVLLSDLACEDVLINHLVQRARDLERAQV